MPRAGRHLAHQVGGRLAERRHTAGPVLPVAVLHHQGQGRAQGAAEPHAASHLHQVALDLLTASAAIARLAAAQVAVDLVGRHLQSRRHAGHDGREFRPVAFACCDVVHGGFAFRGGSSSPPLIVYHASHVVGNKPPGSGNSPHGRQALPRLATPRRAAGSRRHTFARAATPPAFSLAADASSPPSVRPQGGRSRRHLP